MAYSTGFRRQVFNVKHKEGLTFQELGEQFCIPTRTLFRWHKRIKPKTSRNKPFQPRSTWAVYAGMWNNILTDIRTKKRKDLVSAKEPYPMP